jgi:hypothetical protein
VLVLPTATAATASTRTGTITTATSRFARAICTRRSENGKPLGQLARPAVRALGPFPFAGADQDFAVSVALIAMKFVNRHARRIADLVCTSS